MVPDRVFTAEAKGAAQPNTPVPLRQPPRGRGRRAWRDRRRVRGRGPSAGRGARSKRGKGRARGFSTKRRSVAGKRAGQRGSPAAGEGRAAGPGRAPHLPQRRGLQRCSRPARPCSCARPAEGLRRGGAAPGPERLRRLRGEECGMGGAGWEVRGAGYEMRGAGWEVRDAGCGVQDGSCADIGTVGMVERLGQGWPRGLAWVNE